MNFWIILLIALGCATAVGASATRGEAKPNIIIIYADDLGYGDLGCYGHPSIRTPNLDRMAAEGMRFTDFYSAGEVCTPSRAALLTGRYPIRSGMCHNQFRVLRSKSKGGLPKEEVTLAELLRDRGYRTGMIGKWHLGHLPEHLPPQHGFDFYLGLPFSNDMMPTAEAPKGRAKFFAEKNEYWETPLLLGTRVLEAKPDQRTLTRRYTDEAVKFIRMNQKAPFFLYLAHTFPHVPLFASDQFHGRSPAGLYGDVVEELDWSIGQVLDQVRKSGLSGRTLVIFSSDNGPWLTYEHHGGSAGPLREGKGSTWEGGMRVPGIAWWPGRIPSGRIQREVGLTLDLFPTVAKLAGAPLSKTVLDGVDMSPLLFGTGTVNREPFLYYRGSTLYAARMGPWKAHFISQSAWGSDKPVFHDPPLLFHLGLDPGEKWNCAGTNAVVLAQIQAVVEKHRAGLVPVPTQLVETVGH